jgi:hypothetical protein
MATWSQITFSPSAESVAALRRHWEWKLGSRWTPIMFSVIGDVFIELDAKSVWWLSTATGSLEQVADSQDEFRQLLGTDRADEWFLPGLVDALLDQGKVPGSDQCYSYAILPVFAQGSFSAENMNPVPASEHFSLTGYVHQQIHGAPDGANVEIKVV